MSNPKTLKPYASLTDEEKKELHRKGGLACNAKKRRKRQLKEIIGLLGNMDAIDETIRERRRQHGRGNGGGNNNPPSGELEG